MVRDENGNRTTMALENCTVLEMMIRPREKQYPNDSDKEVVPVVMTDRAKIITLLPSPVGWHYTHLSQLNNSIYGLHPMIDVDPFVESCFDMGYSEVIFGPSAYAGAFGVTARFKKGEKEPRTNSFPSVWKLVEDFGLRCGAGSGHGMQMCKFLPMGKYRFGSHLARMRAHA